MATTSCFAVEIGGTNLYAATCHLGHDGKYEPCALLVEQVDENGLARIYSHALPAVACWEGGSLCLGRRARHILSNKPVKAISSLRSGLGVDETSIKSLSALLRYLQSCVGRVTGRGYEKVVLVGVEGERQMAAAMAASAVGLEVPPGGFVDWLEAALLDWQHSELSLSGGSSTDNQTLMVLDIGGQETGIALLEMDTSQSRIVVKKVYRKTIPWGGRNFDRKLMIRALGVGTVEEWAAQEIESGFCSAKEEITRLVDDGVPPEAVRSEVLLPDGGTAKVTFQDLEEAIRLAVEEGLLPVLKEISNQSRGLPDLLLIGGGSRPAAVVAALQEIFGARVWQPVAPELALVRGAILSYSIRSGVV